MRFSPVPALLIVGSAAVGAAFIVWLFAPPVLERIRSRRDPRGLEWSVNASESREGKQRSNEEVVAALCGVKEELTNGRRELREDLTAIRDALLHRGDGAALGRTTDAATPARESEWAALLSATEARLLAEKVARYRWMIFQQLACQEEGVQQSEGEGLGFATEALEQTKKMLEELNRVRSLDDLGRWRNKYNMGDLP